jgi:hypothetical protein
LTAWVTGAGSGAFTPRSAANAELPAIKKAMVLPSLRIFAVPKIASGIYLLPAWRAVAFWQQARYFSSRWLNLIQV